MYPAPARRYALCRGALRAILCAQVACSNLDLAIVASERGKPYALIQGALAGISFNVSHSGKHGLLAFASEGRLGVDVEERAAPPELHRLVASVLTPVEQAEVALLSRPELIRSFFTLWTIKEALTKALETGLAFDVSTLEVPAAMRQGETSSVFRFPDMPGISWQVENLGCDEFAAAVAYEVVAPSEKSDMGKATPEARAAQRLDS